jgi:ABC-type nitrate/sulfonate/bicarbonate transport system substrate-binding protein
VPRHQLTAAVAGVNRDGQAKFAKGELRELVRYRAKLVQLRSGLKAQVHAVMAKHGVLPLVVDMFGPSGQVQLDQLQLGHGYTVRVESLRDLIEIYDREVDMVAVGPGRLLNAATAGGDLVGVANLGNDLDYRLIARPEIKKPEDLHGKRVAISGPGSVSHIVALLALQKLGIDPRQARVTFLAIPGTEVNYRTALETGTVDAAPLNGPVGDYYSSRGYSLLYNLQTSGVAMPQDLLVTTKRILTSRAPIVEAQIKAFVEAIAYLQDARNKASVKRSVASNMRLNDETVIEETYQTVLQSYERAPYPNLDGMKQLQTLLTSVNPKLKDLKTETIVDGGFISRLESSGFIQNLYKKP